jgi:hypothetical protein
MEGGLLFLPDGSCSEANCFVLGAENGMNHQQAKGLPIRGRAAGGAGSQAIEN